MADGHGGYRKPSNPAPVSGPGRMSARTDGGPGAKQGAAAMTGGPYGESQDLAQLQQSATMAASGVVKPGTSQPLLGSTPSPVEAPFDLNAASPSPVEAPFDLNAATTAPDEPISAGAPYGAGPGPEVLRQGARPGQSAAVLASMLPFDTDGTIRAMFEVAKQNGW